MKSPLLLLLTSLAIVSTAMAAPANALFIAVDDVRTELRRHGAVPGDGKISPEMARHLVRGGRASVTLMNAQLGLRENSAIAFGWDHGYHRDESGTFTKMTDFKLGSYVPLIVSVQSGWKVALP